MHPSKKDYYPYNTDEKHSRKHPHQHVPHDKYPPYHDHRGKPNRKQEDRKPNKSPPKTCDTSYDAIEVIRREVFIFKDTVSCTLYEIVNN